jgi:monoamine oxidase
MPEPYDYIIIGSGIAGLYSAVELAKAKPRARIAVFEREKELGGRVYTFRKKVKGVKLQWEAGAGRISENHTIIHELLKRYKLSVIPIGHKILYKETYTTPLEPDAFEPGIPIFMDTLNILPKDILAKNTIRQLLTEIHGAALTEKYLLRFPYRAEVDVMRADMSLKLFSHEFRRTEEYGICAEGLSSLIDAMYKDARQRGVKFYMKHELLEVAQEGLVRATFKEKTVEAHNCVLAVPVEALKRIGGFKAWEPCRHLRMEPLLRFYGTFPKGPDGKVWYEAYGGRIITATPIRYIIPGNPKDGSAHMSYTDTQDARYWMKKIKAKGEEEVGKEMLGEMRRLLGPEIPEPTFVKAHSWRNGVTYWLPGSYDPAEISRNAFTPMPESMPNVHICGESFSMRQGWMEGAVENAALLLEILLGKLNP